MDFISCVRQQMKWHPSMEPQDMYKLCYQVAFGAEHLIQDEERAWIYLQTEYEQTTANRKWPLVEWLSQDVARVNLATYKAMGLPLRHLFELFVEGARGFCGSEEKLSVYIDLVEEMAGRGELCFDVREWKTFCDTCPKGPVHHSPNYKIKEQPAYRVISGHRVRQIEELLG